MPCPPDNTSTPFFATDPSFNTRHVHQNTARPRQLKELERKREQQQKATLRQLAEKQNEAAVLIDNFCAEFDKDGDG